MKLFVKIASFGQDVNRQNGNQRNHHGYITGSSSIGVPRCMGKDKVSEEVFLEPNNSRLLKGKGSWIAKSFANVVKGDYQYQEMAKSASDVKRIKIDPGNNEWLHRSATATLLKMVSLSKITEDLRKNNYDNVQVRHMGG